MLPSVVDRDRFEWLAACGGGGNMPHVLLLVTDEAPQTVERVMRKAAVAL